MSSSLIRSDPRVLGGKPTIAGTRISVAFLLERMAAGETEGDLLSEFPSLTADAIRAALDFAAAAIRADVVYPAADEAA